MKFVCSCKELTRTRERGMFSLTQIIQTLETLQVVIICNVNMLIRAHK